MRYQIINEAKKKLGLTNAQLSEMTGVTLTTIEKIASGANQNPKICTLQALAAPLGLTLDDFSDTPTSPVSVPELTPDESALVATYRALNPTGQEVLRTTAQSLALNPDMAAQAPGAAQFAPSLQSAQSPPADRPA